MPQRDVQVTSNKTGKVVGIYTVVLESLNYEPADHEYFDQAITAAIEDGAVTKDEINDVTFSRLSTPPSPAEWDGAVDLPFHHPCPRGLAVGRRKRA
jgi:hypothetical protein